MPICMLLFFISYGVIYVQELFSEVGDLKRYAVHYDRSGRSKVSNRVWHKLVLLMNSLCPAVVQKNNSFSQGTAEVVFSRRTDAVNAVKRYNNVQLDGKPMKIEIVGTNVATPAAPPAANGTFGNSNGIARGYASLIFFSFKISGYQLT